LVDTDALRAELEQKGEVVGEPGVLPKRVIHDTRSNEIFMLVRESTLEAWNASLPNASRLSHVGDDTYAQIVQAFLAQELLELTGPEPTSSPQSGREWVGNDGRTWSSFEGDHAAFYRHVRNEAEREIWDPAQHEPRYVSVAVCNFLRTQTRSDIPKPAECMEQTAIQHHAAQVVIEWFRKLQSWQEGWLNQDLAKLADRTASPTTRHTPLLVAAALKADEGTVLERMCPTAAPAGIERIIWMDLHWTADVEAREVAAFLLAVHEYACWYFSIVSPSTRRTFVYGDRKPWYTAAQDDGQQGRDGLLNVVLIAIRHLYGCQRVKLLPTEEYGALTDNVYTLPTMLYRHFQTAWAMSFVAYIAEVMPRVLSENVRDIGQAIKHMSRQATKRALSGAAKGPGHDAMDVDDESGHPSTYQQTYTGAAGGTGQGGRAKGHETGKRDSWGKGWETPTPSLWQPRSYTPGDTQGWWRHTDWRWNSGSTWDSSQTWESSPHR
jgi:hypothetical protein